MTYEHHIKDKLQLEILVEKHLSGQHDQSSHAGGKKVAGVPDHVDLEGKRYDKAAAQEFRKRLIDYENARGEATEKFCQETYGKSWNELTSYAQSTIIDGNELVNRKPLAEVLANDPNVMAAKNAYEDHFLYKDAANQLAYNEDGTLGPKTIKELGKDAYGDTVLERMSRGIMASASEEKPLVTEGKTRIHARDDNGKRLVDEDTGQNVMRDVSVDANDLAQADADWQQFGEDADVTYVCSNKALRSILASGDVKNYLQAERPARAGTSGEGYKNRRLVYENNAFGYTTDDDPAVRPISTFVTANHVMHPDLLNGYGGVQVVLKPSVRDRATVTSMDSLNVWERPTSYKQFFDKPTSNYYRVQGAAERKVNGKTLFTAKHFDSYPEAQVHGGVSVNDFSKVIFQSAPPTAIASKLDRMSIPYEVVDQGGEQGTW